VVARGETGQFTGDNGLVCLLDTVQIDSRAAVRLFSRHPLRELFLGFSVEVIAQFFVQFLVRPRPAKQ